MWPAPPVLARGMTRACLRVQTRSYMNVHTRPSHSGMFDKQNPPKPPSPKRSFLPKLVVGVALVFGIKYWNERKEENKQQELTKKE